MAASDLTVTLKLADLVPETLAVADASVRYFDCLCEFEGEPGGPCSEWADAWDTAVIALKRARDAQAATEAKL